MKGCVEFLTCLHSSDRTTAPDRNFLLCRLKNVKLARCLRPLSVAVRNLFDWFIITEFVDSSKQFSNWWIFGVISHSSAFSSRRRQVSTKSELKLITLKAPEFDVAAFDITVERKLLAPWRLIPAFNSSCSALSCTLFLITLREYARIQFFPLLLVCYRSFIYKSRESRRIDSWRILC